MLVHCNQAVKNILQKVGHIFKPPKLGANLTLLSNL